MPKLSVGESFTVALFSDSEKSLDRRGGGESRFSVELFMSQSARKIRRESFTVALLLGYRKRLEKRWGGIKILRRNFFFSQCRNIPYGNPLLLQ